MPFDHQGIFRGEPRIIDYPVIRPRRADGVRDSERPDTLAPVDVNLNPDHLAADLVTDTDRPDTTSAVAIAVGTTVPADLVADADRPDTTTPGDVLLISYAVADLVTDANRPDSATPIIVEMTRNISADLVTSSDRPDALTPLELALTGYLNADLVADADRPDGTTPVSVQLVSYLDADLVADTDRPDATTPASVELISQGFAYIGGDNDDVRKIDPDGNQVWAFTGHTARVTDVAADADGYAYSISEDNTVRKIDPDGNQVWSFTGATALVIGQDVAVDKAGNVYAGDQLGRLYKIDPDGNEQWMIDVGDMVQDIAIHASGYIWVVEGTNLHKYAPNGTLVWTSNLGYTLNGVAVGTDEYSYLAADSGSTFLLIIQVDPNGSEGWDYTLGGTDADAQCITVDSNDYVYVGEYAFQHHVCRKLDPNGNLVWTYTALDNAPSEISVDAQGNVYVVCDDLFKIDANGDLVWEYTGHGANLRGVDVHNPDMWEGFSVEADLDGAVMWLDASATHTVTESSGDVSQWDAIIEDLFESGTPPSTSPVYSATSFNGRPGITMSDGVTDYLTATATADASTDWELYAVMDSQAISSYLIDIQSGRLVYMSESTNGDGPGIYDGSFRTVGDEHVTGPQILTFVCDSSTNTLEIFRDGVSIGTASYTSRSVGGTFAIGGRYTDGANALGGTIAELVLCNQVQTAAKRATAVDALQQKWALGDYAASPDFTGLTRHEWTVENMGTTYANNAQVTSWTDIATGIELMPGASTGVTYLDVGDLGTPAVSFDGSSDLITSAAQGLDWSGGLTVFMVQKLTSWTQFGGPMSARQNGDAYNQNAVENYYGTSGARYAWPSNRDPGPIGYWNLQGGALNSVSTLIQSVRYDGTNLNPADGPITVNGAQITDADGLSEPASPLPPTNTIDWINMGSGYNRTFWNGEICAMVIYTGRHMTQAEVDAVVASLNSRFEVY